MSQELNQLRAAVEEIWEASRSTGLDPYPIHFEIVPATIMYEVGSYGLPGRFSHWTHGKAYHQMKTMYDYGLSKIYELIINTDPAVAYLLEGNSLVQNKLVIAHVIGHSDFFKNNAYFRHTNRQMAESAAVNAKRLRQYEFEHGAAAVEACLDAALAVQEHIDPNLRMRRKPDPEQDDDPRRHTSYDDLWDLEDTEDEAAETSRKPSPEKDLLYFLATRAPDLEDWQRDALSIIREEMIYFLPQMQTKILNEGWASFWHSRILREMGLSATEHLEFSRLHASVLSPSPRGTQINPYYVGFKILEDIERRWNGDMDEKERREYAESHHGREWTHSGEGRAKLFEVREVESDVSFLRNYLTERLVRELDLYIYERQGDEWVVVESDWRKVRDALVASKTNLGHPYIEVEDGDYRRARELFLRHRHEGRDLDLGYARHALEHVYHLWQRPVHVGTVIEEEPSVLSYDGEEHVLEVAGKRVEPEAAQEAA